MWVKHLILVHDFTLLLFNITFAFGHTARGVFLSTGIRKLILDQPGRPVVTVVRVVLGIRSRLVTGVSCLVQIQVVVDVNGWGFADREGFCEFGPVATFLLSPTHVSASSILEVSRCRASLVLVIVAGPGLMRVDGVGPGASLVPLNQQTSNGQDGNSCNSNTHNDGNIRRCRRVV